MLLTGPAWRACLVEPAVALLLMSWPAPVTSWLGSPGMAEDLGCFVAAVLVMVSSERRLPEDPAVPAERVFATRRLSDSVVAAKTGLEYVLPLWLDACCALRSWNDATSLLKCGPSLSADAGSRGLAALAAS